MSYCASRQSSLARVIDSPNSRISRSCMLAMVLRSCLLSRRLSERNYFEVALKDMLTCVYLHLLIDDFVRGCWLHARLNFIRAPGTRFVLAKFLSRGASYDTIVSRRGVHVGSATRIAHLDITLALERSVLDEIAEFKRLLCVELARRRFNMQ